jgi:AAA domain
MPAEFKKAVRKQVKLKLGISGPSGSGKTWGAISLAGGLGSKIAVIDTENGSASLYADKFNFDVLEITAPFTTAKYIDALSSAVKLGYDVVVIDSITHEWAANGGILEQKANIDAKGGNNWTNWKIPSADHERWKADLLLAPVHVIATMRAKAEYVLEANDKGKQQPRRIGMAPIQKDGIEYEFSILFDLALNHDAIASKDRTGLFDGRSFRLSNDIGAEIKTWLASGQEIALSAEAKTFEERLMACTTEEQLKSIAVDISKIMDSDAKAHLKPIYSAKLSGIQNGAKS